MTWRKVPSGDHFDQKLFDKLVVVSTSLTTRSLSGMIYVRALKFLKPPRDTTGYLITWNLGSVKYHIQEHWTADPIKMKKVTASSSEDLCVLYLFYHVFNQEEDTQRDLKKSITSNMEPSDQSTSTSTSTIDSTSMNEDDISMQSAIPEPDRKRDGPDTRTVVMAPEKKKMRLDYWSSHSIYYNASAIHHLMDCRKKIRSDLPTSWTGTQLWAENATAEKLFSDAVAHHQQCRDLANHEYLFHISSSTDAILNVDLRTSEVLSCGH